MRIAIVHDSFTQYGGAERVVESFHELFPEAPVFTMVVDLKKYPKDLSTWDIRTSFLQNIYTYHRNFKHFLTLLPFANASFNFSGFDVILSSSSLFLKGLTVPRGSTHINYCHTPVRFLWSEPGYIDQEVPKGLRWVVRGLLPWLHGYDKTSAKKPNVILANSVEVKNRIKEYYNREVEVVYPFVDTEFWKSDMRAKSINNSLSPNTLTLSPDPGYFLIGGRLQAHKDAEQIIRLFNELHIPLHVVGAGTHEKYLRSIAKPNIVFLGRVSDEVLRDEYSGAQGFIFPQLEDFGLMPLEAASCGTATIGLAKGGTLETVIPGVTGELFDGSMGLLQQIITSWDPGKYSQEALRANAEKFSKEKFNKRIGEIVMKGIGKI